jgi:hypothetical protein
MIKNVEPASEVGIASMIWNFTFPKNLYKINSSDVNLVLSGSYQPEWSIISGWYETAFERGNLKNSQINYYLKALGSSKSCYKLSKEFKSEYFTEYIYQQLDPYFKNQFENADIRIFQRKK